MQISQVSQYTAESLTAVSGEAKHLRFGNIAPAVQLHKKFLNANGKRCQYSTIKCSKTYISIDTSSCV